MPQKCSEGIKMESFATIVNDLNPLTIIVKLPLDETHLDVVRGAF